MKIVIESKETVRIDTIKFGKVVQLDGEHYISTDLEDGTKLVLINVADGTKLSIHRDTKVDLVEAELIIKT